MSSYIPLTVSVFIALLQDPLGLPARFVSQKTNGTSTISGNIMVASCTDPGTSVRRWTIAADSSIRVGNTTMCLDAYNCGTADGTAVDVYACHPQGKVECGYTNQQWSLSGGTIINANSKSCLTLNGTSVVLSRCVPGDHNQQISFRNGALVVGDGDACLYGESTTNSADITSQIFARPLKGGDTAVVLFNRDETATTLTVTWAELGLNPSTPFAVRDVINHADLPHTTVEWRATVGKHDVAFIRLSPL